MRKIRVSGKHIGEEGPCFIIAEAGSNHNGCLEQAKKKNSCVSRSVKIIKAKALIMWNEITIGKKNATP